MSGMSLGEHLEIAGQSLSNLRSSRPDAEPIVLVVGAESPRFSLSRGDLHADSNSILMAIADLSAQIMMANATDSLRGKATS